MTLAETTEQTVTELTVPASVILAVLLIVGLATFAVVRSNRHRAEAFRKMQRSYDHQAVQYEGMRQAFRAMRLPMPDLPEPEEQPEEKPRRHLRGLPFLAWLSLAGAWLVERVRKHPVTAGTSTALLTAATVIPFVLPGSDDAGGSQATEPPSITRPAPSRAPRQPVPTSQPSPRPTSPPGTSSSINVPDTDEPDGPAAEPLSGSETASDGQASAKPRPQADSGSDSDTPPASGGSDQAPRSPTPGGGSPPPARNAGDDGAGDDGASGPPDRPQRCTILRVHLGRVVHLRVPCL